MDALMLSRAGLCVHCRVLCLSLSLSLSLSALSVVWHSYQMCVDGAGHDQTCHAEKGCIFSPKYATMAPFQQQCHAAFGVTPEQTAAAVAFNSANYGDNRSGNRL